MLKAVIGANIALFAVDRFLDLDFLLPLAALLAIGAFLLLSNRGRTTRTEMTMLGVVVALGAVELLEAGLLPVIRI